MARKTETYVLEDGERDKGKTVLITEMDAESAAVYTATALQLLAMEGLSGEDVKTSINANKLRVTTGWIRALQNPAVECWRECVQFIADPALPPQKLFKGAACQLEDPQTFWMLPFKVLALHLGFFSDANPLTTGLPSKRKRQGSSSTKTSRAVSDLLSQASSRP